LRTSDIANILIWGRSYIAVEHGEKVAGQASEELVAGVRLDHFCPEPPYHRGRSAEDRGRGSVTGNIDVAVVGLVWLGK